MERDGRGPREKRSEETFTAFAPGKVILLGEHSVVYGHGAVAGPLSWGVTVRARPARRCQLAPLSGPGLDEGRRKKLEKAFARAAKACGSPKVEVSVESDLPVSMGLGSSGALAVACARALLMSAGKKVTASAVDRVALEMEREFHGHPSGVDHTTSATGKLVYFAAGKAKPLPCPKPLKVLVALVGERDGTKEMVAGLRERRSRWPKRYDRLLSELGSLAREGAKAVRDGDFEALGDAMNVCQGVLSALQLSSPAVEQMVHRLRSWGALGAKLTGAGGNGGAVIGLFLEPEPLLARLGDEGIRCFASQIAGPRAL